MTEQTRSQTRRAFQRSTLLITNAFKLAGLFIAIREVLRPNRDASVLALAAFMMSGAQLSEEFFLAAIDSFLGRQRDDAS